MKQIVVLSGKGGTGKTSFTASLLPFLPKTVVVDCDVDAPDLDILLKPEQTASNPFFGGLIPKVDKNACVGCGSCLQNCHFGAIEYIEGKVQILSGRCEGCGLCEVVCPHHAIRLEKREVGHLLEGKTQFGSMVYGKLYPGEENSGKLVAAARERGVEIANREGADYLLLDGTPGVGCGVIASMKGADRVVVVTEPTKSGLSDLKRLVKLAERFRIPITVVLNKADLSEAGKDEVQNYCLENKLDYALEIPFLKEWLTAIENESIPSMMLQDDFKKIQFPQFVKKLTQSLY